MSATSSWTASDPSPASPARSSTGSAGSRRRRPRPADVASGPAHEVVVEEVAARPIAAVRAKVPTGEVAAAWRPALDKVWAFLRSQDGLWTGGHNIFIYRHPAQPG